MPVPKQPDTEQQSSSKLPQHLRPYAFHGVALPQQHGSHVVGDCPFCGGNGKFSVAVDTGLWRCFVCGGGTDRGGGNALVFLRLLHASVVTSTDPVFYGAVAEDRRLLDPATVAAWGVCQAVDDTWLVPGYGTDGSLNQLYRRVWSKGAWRLMPTPGVWPEGKVHALHMPAATFDTSWATISITEGPWDGMALSEVSERVVAVPGCTTWRDEWSTMCKGKHVTLWYDSDHPRTHGGKVFRAGHDGMQRVAKRLSGVAASVRWLRWGPEGYDSSRPSGWDVRDELSVGPAQHALPYRQLALNNLLSKVEDAPADWFSKASSPSLNGKSHHQHHGFEPQSCSRWEECEAAWKEAMYWRQDMSWATAVLFAVCASTNQGGNQLFLDLVGNAGSGKTTLCEGLLVSSHCHHLEHLTGFHSGWRLPEDQDKDCSPIARMNGKTLVTPEFDIMRSSPRYAELMGQTRRIFDGKSGATYKNTDKDTLYVGLRTPWIRAGTPAIMDTDQASMGDRFLRFIISDPATEDEKRSIMRSALRSERVAMLDTANGTAASLVDPKMRKAQALTGGYVDWLRANVEKQLATVDVDQAAEDRCIDLAELSADMRARPNEDKRKREVHDSKELPTRLARQNIRMASCLAVVLNKKLVDAEVLRIVRKVALDTAHGHTLNIVQWMCSANPKAGGKSYQECGGLVENTLSMWTGMNNERLANYLTFLRKIGVVDWREGRMNAGVWLLTERVYELYSRVMKG